MQDQTCVVKILEYSSFCVRDGSWITINIDMVHRIGRVSINLTIYWTYARVCMYFIGFYFFSGYSLKNQLPSAANGAPILFSR